MKDQSTLFDLPPESKRESAFKHLKYPIWTENKAKLIERYLYYFVLITKHGTYIDGFSGPQEPDKPGMWSAKLVLESKPRWFRNFYLFEKDPAQISKLKKLKTEIINDPETRLKRNINTEFHQEQNQVDDGAQQQYLPDGIDRHGRGVSEPDHDGVWRQGCGEGRAGRPRRTDSDLPERQRPGEQHGGGGQSCGVEPAGSQGHPDHDEERAWPSVPAGRLRHGEGEDEVLALHHGLLQWSAV